MHRGLGRYHEVSHQHPQRHQQPVLLHAGKGLSQVVAHGHEPYVHPRQKQRQAHIRVQKPRHDAQHLAPGQVQNHQLAPGKERRDGRKGDGHLTQIFRQGMGELAGQLQRVRRVGQGGVRPVGRAVRPVNQAQQHHRQNGTYGAERHQAEAVVFRIGVAADGAHAHAQRQDERHRHGARGHAAGVKGHGQKRPRHKLRQHKHQRIAPQQQPRHADAQQNAQKRQHQKHAHAQRYRYNQRQVRHAGHLMGQHLQIRLRYGHDHADQKGAQKHHPQLFAAGHGCAHVLADGDHGQVRAQREQSHAHHQQHRARQKRQHRARGCRHRQQAQRNHDSRDRQDRTQ